jgi:UDP-3-O-[3-hydroxymyristoyl] glucosamine N-acyltransferase
VIDKVEYIDQTARIWHNCVIRDGVYIGAHTVIGHLVVIERDTKIGNHTTIQSQCHITADAEIGDYVFIGPCVSMGNERIIANHGRCEAILKGPKIGRGVRIGANSYIVAGVEIGDNAFIHACSLVTKNVPAGEVWGNATRAKRLGKVPREQWL